MKKNKTVKIFAILWLLGIIVSVVWTWILVLTSTSQSTQEQVKTFDPETFKVDWNDNVDLQKIIDQNEVEVKVWTWESK